MHKETPFSHLASVWDARLLPTMEMYQRWGFPSSFLSTNPGEDYTVDLKRRSSAFSMRMFSLKTGLWIVNE